jgi:hypothetical protein
MEKLLVSNKHGLFHFGMYMDQFHMDCGISTSPIRTRAPRGFCILRDQVLVLYSRQELDPLAVNGQEHGPITDLIFIK